MATDTSIEPDGTGWSSSETLFAQLDHLVHAQPQRVIVEGKRLLEQSPGDATLGMDVWAAIGRALYELGDMNRARDAMRRALHFGVSVDVSGSANEPVDRLVGVRVSAAAIFAESGQLREALEQLEQAEVDSVSMGIGRVQSQRAFILAHAGRLVAASHAADLAETTLHRTGDHLGQLRLLVIRSLIELQRGDLGRAEAVLLKAQRKAQVLGQDVIAAGIVANLGVVHARAGRIVIALQHFDDARDRYIEAGKPLRMMTVLEADRAEALLRAGLFSDAVAAAHGAVAQAAGSGSLVARGDAELLLARTQLSAGLHGIAERTARAAATLLRSGHRSGVAMQAQAIGLQAALGSTASDDEAAKLMTRSRRLGERLEREGWTEMSDDLRCARLRCASRFDRMEDVSDDFAALRSSLRSRRPAVALRAWYAESLARGHSGDARAAMRSARLGMRALDRYRTSSEDLQIRAGLSAIGADLASLAVHMAVVTGSPGSLFTWAERTRAHAYGLEKSSATDRGVTMNLTTVAKQLRSRVLVEFVIDRDQISAVVVGRSRSRIVALGPLKEVLRALDQLVAWLDRAMESDGASRMGPGHQVAQRLSQLLIEPLDLAPNADIVIIPVHALHGVPWSSLPHLNGSTFVVHLSARLWLASDRRAASTEATSVGLIIGPDVAGASVERAAVRRLYPRTTTVAGSRATPRRLKAMLNGSDAVQIAAHGVFRADRPLRSTLRLHGGEMAIYELNDVDVRSGLVILSSCEAGVHGVNSGGEVLGLVAILLSRGASTVLAPMHTVPDMACAEFVADFHEEWATGATAAQALAVVRRRWLARPTLAHWATAAAFTCFGSGQAAIDRSAEVATS